MRNYDLLIFDWDGTLVDSIGRIVQAIWLAADACALPRRDEAAVKGIIGLAMPQAIRVLYPQLAKVTQVTHFQQIYAEYYLASESTPSPFYPQVVATLKHFREEGYQLAVATGKTRRGLDRVLTGHGWQDFFDITRCADETASKPDPLMLQEILAHCQVEPARAVMVGDSVFDLQMAARADITAVAVTYGAQPRATLQAEQPALIIEHFAQLASWLAAGNS